MSTLLTALGWSCKACPDPALPKSTGGAVPACFFIPFVFAVTAALLILISHTAGKSIGASACAADGRLGL